MLTSYRIDSTAAVAADQGALSESLPHGIPFSNIFSAMFSVQHDKTNGELGSANASQLSGLNDLSRLDLGSVDFSSLSVSELQQLLPQGLSADVLAQLDNLARTELPELQTLSEKLQSLSDEIARGEVSSLNPSEVGQESIAVKVNELNQIALPKAQITSELDRRGIANELNLLEQGESTLDDMPKSLSESYTLSEFDEETLDVNDLVQTDEQHLESAFNVVNSSEAMMKEATAQHNAIKVNHVDAEDVIDAPELGFSAATSVNGVPVTGVDTASQAASQVARQAQPQVATVAQNNYQVSWGTSSESSVSTSANDSSTMSQNSNGQGNSQSQLAQQQVMQQQVLKSQAVDQQMMLKASDELAAKISSPDEGIDLVTSERRSQLPTGLQTINVPVKSPQWGQSVAHRISFMANNQIQQAQITLNPEKLGPIQIKLHVDRDQQVHVSMTAQHGTTREAIEAAMPRLKEMLEQSGLDLASVDVSDQQQFAENQESNSSSSSANQAEQSNDLEVSEDVVTTAISSDNLVDYYA